MSLSQQNLYFFIFQLIIYKKHTTRQFICSPRKHPGQDGSMQGPERFKVIGIAKTILPLNVDPVPGIPQCSQKLIVLNWIPGVIYPIRGDDETG